MLPFASQTHENHTGANRDWKADVARFLNVNVWVTAWGRALPCNRIILDVDTVMISFNNCHLKTLYECLTAGSRITLVQNYKTVFIHSIRPNSST